MAYFESVMNLGGDGHGKVVPITVFVAVLCLCLVIGHLFEENRWVNESITAIFIGCITGVIILLISKGKSSHILRFDEELFFIYLLPPIIFNAGFQVKKKQFFQNFLTILLFGVVGVFISTLIITAGSWWMFPKIGFVGLTPRDYLAIGTIFSSTDTVCTLQVLHQDESPLLYSLVFGEGVVNDATSVVLFNAVGKIDVNRLDGWAAAHVLVDFLYLFSTSTVLGVATGLSTAYILKGLNFGKHSSVREIALMTLMAYLSYMLAELLQLSGILTVFFCGILMSHYAWHNVTESSRITSRHAFATMSFIAETFIFLYVGMDALDIEKWRTSKLSFGTSLGIYASTIFLICLGRAAFVFPLSAFSNYMNRNADRSSSITFKHQFTYSGVTWDPLNATMVTTTIIVVLFSTIVFGFLTKPLINYLLPHCSHSQEPRSPKEDLTLPFVSFEESTATNIIRAKDSLSMLMERPVFTIHYYWRMFDDNYMRPIFGRPRADQSYVV
ncbi:sodium/hydrogen exchanger 4 isoform X2 [Camellia sinensis]|uniref:sodium/hydrogen exchanger 4 isoform X2 n=1 Tax=Camellia sinensis TaxID=4442 RepID=UPI0010359D61|nr:sodium/hydrogen exchanger 4 isoform X2 [Camellia sinensis]